MSTDTLILLAGILIVGIPAVIALFLIPKSLTASQESAEKTQSSITRLAEAVVQAATHSSSTSRALAEAIQALERRVSEAVHLQEVSTTEDRKIAATIAADNRETLRQGTNGIASSLSKISEDLGEMRKLQASTRDKLDEIRDRATNLTALLKSENEAQRKWAQERLTDTVEKSLECVTRQSDKIAIKLDEGSRLLQRSNEASAADIAKQLHLLGDLAQAIGSISSQLHQNGQAIDGLRKTISADVTSLTGD